MLRAMAYVMALPGIASLNEHYGKDRDEQQLIASTGFATGAFKMMDFVSKMMKTSSQMLKIVLK